MLTAFLPDKVGHAINFVNFNSLNEIRLRLGKPVAISLSGKNFYLSPLGPTVDYDLAIICEKHMIDEVLRLASNNSLYTINDQLIKGFITLGGGIRVGVAGDVVTDNGDIKTIKNINSLNIRIAHNVKNCSLDLYNYIINAGKVYNTLIISPPGAGKTTFLRDLAYQIGKRETNLNLLIVDERSEISGSNLESEKTLDIGNFTDIYTNCTKSFAFENGIRSMKPDVIITDEINLSDDVTAIENAISSGVNVVATIHAKNIEDLRLKKNFQKILNEKMFNRFVVLSLNNGPGTIEGVYNENLKCVYV